MSKKVKNKDLVKFMLYFLETKKTKYYTINDIASTYILEHTDDFNKLDYKERKSKLVRIISGYHVLFSALNITKTRNEKRSSTRRVYIITPELIDGIRDYLKGKKYTNDIPSGSIVDKKFITNYLENEIFREEQDHHFDHIDFRNGKYDLPLRNHLLGILNVFAIVRMLLTGSEEKLWKMKKR